MWNPACDVIFKREPADKAEAAKKWIRNFVGDENAEPFLVWSCKTLQNWKAIFAYPQKRMLFEATWDGDKNRMYVDVYKKEYNVVLTNGGGD